MRVSPLLFFSTASLLLAACGQLAPLQPSTDLVSPQVMAGGEVVAWGDNSYGQTNVPVLPAGERYTAVAGGLYHSLALRSDGQVVGWGNNDYGQTSVPTLLLYKTF